MNVPSIEEFDALPCYVVIATPKKESEGELITVSSPNHSPKEAIDSAACMQGFDMTTKLIFGITWKTYYEIENAIRDFSKKQTVAQRNMDIDFLIGDIVALESVRTSQTEPQLRF